MNHKPLRAGGKRRSVRLKERSRVESKVSIQLQEFSDVHALSTMIMIYTMISAA